MKLHKLNVLDAYVFTWASKETTMLHRVYTLFIQPISPDPDYRSRELVLNWILFSIGCLLLLISPLCLLNFFIDSQIYTLVAFLCVNILIVALVLYAYKLRRKKYIQDVARKSLIISLVLIGSLLVAEWGLNNIYGILSFSLAIMMAGILISARYSLHTATAIGIVLILLDFARVRHIITPDTSWIGHSSSTDDNLLFITIFFIIALVSWLFNRQMEESLHRARQSEEALKKERDLLEIKVEERTRALQEAQLEKVQQFYKFAELGHLSTALFHDLAGSLSSLSIDIESMRKKGQADFTKRIDSNIHYIDNVVQRVKSQIQGKDIEETFDVISEVKDLVGILSYNARKSRTWIDLQTPNSHEAIYFTGNVTRFRQLIINLLSNGIEAYPPTINASVKDRPVIIKISDNKNSLTLQVTDYGKGIRKGSQSKIFDPFYTTKSSGSGIGLFIVRQVAENDFSGTISLTSNKKNGTTFTVVLPK
jgi:signal transduction histidine kinase